MALPATLANLGGPPHCCAGPCKHIDCAETRALVGTTCKGCGRTIRSGDDYSYLSDPHQIGHAKCVADAFFGVYK